MITERPDLHRNEPSDPDHHPAALERYLLSLTMQILST
jgi:hypothetical protein